MGHRPVAVINGFRGGKSVSTPPRTRGSFPRTVLTRTPPNGVAELDVVYRYRGRDGKNGYVLAISGVPVQVTDPRGLRFFDGETNATQHPVEKNGTSSNKKTFMDRKNERYTEKRSDRCYVSLKDERN